MRKILSILLIIFAITTILTGCKSEERKAIEADYSAKAEIIFAEYFTKNYPEKDYQVENIKVLTDKGIDFFVPTYNASKMVKGTIKDNGKTINVYCYVDGKDDDVYTTEYFDTVKSDVEELIKKRCGNEIVINKFEFEGTWKSQWAMNFVGAEFDSYNLLPFSIRSENDLFTYEENSWFYHLNVDANMKKDILLEDLQFDVFFDGMNNASSNDIDIRIHTPENSKMHYVYVNAIKQGDGSIKITPQPRTNRIETDDYNLTYSEHMFTIDIKKVPLEYNYNELSSEEKQFLQNQEKDGFIKTDYIYEVVMELNYPFSGKEKMEFKDEVNGVNLIYNFQAYGDVTLCNSEQYIRLIKRYTESFADRSSKYLHNFIQDFRPESTKDKDEITFYLDVYIND